MKAKDIMEFLRKGNFFKHYISSEYFEVEIPDIEKRREMIEERLEFYLSMIRLDDEE